MACNYRAALKAATPRLDTDPDIVRWRGIVASKADPKERAKAQRTLDCKIKTWLHLHPRSAEARAARR